MTTTTSNTLGFSTRAIHIGSSPDPTTSAVIPPISLSTTFAQHPLGTHKGYEYSRSGNPSRSALEATLAGLEEGGESALAFGSGSATSATVVTGVFGDANVNRAGEEGGRRGHVISVSEVYGGTYRYLTSVAGPTMGIEVTFLDLESITEEEIIGALREDTKLIWIESPTNPTLKMIDISRISSLLSSHYSTLPNQERPYILVDNTFSSPFFSSPLTHGATLVLHSLTKYINGHSDVVAGALIFSSSPTSQELYKKLQFYQNAIGAIPSPFDSWLAQRGAKTLAVRMKEHGLNALKLSRWLEQPSRAHLIDNVIYPGLPSHPSHKVAYSHLAAPALKWISTLPPSLNISEETGFPFSGMVSFRISGDENVARTFLESLKVFTLAESLGGVESLAELPAVMTHGSIPKHTRLALGITDNLIRLSVGIEDIDDLIADVEQALLVAVPTSHPVAVDEKIAELKSTGASGVSGDVTPPPLYRANSFNTDVDFESVSASAMEVLAC